MAEEDWRALYHAELTIRRQREEELRQCRERIAWLQGRPEIQQSHDISNLKHRCYSAENLVEAQRELSQKAWVLSQVATYFSPFAASSVDRNIHTGCDRVISALCVPHDATATRSARAEVADALREILRIACDPGLLLCASDQVVQLAVDSNVLSVKGIILLGLWMVFRNVSLRGEGQHFSMFLTNLVGP